jgi:fucose permease
MPGAFPGSESARQNLGNVFFGLGALVTPALVDILVRAVGFRRTLSVLAVVCLTPAVAVAFTDPNLFPPPQPGHLADVVGRPIVWLTALVFFLYCPLEGAMGTWATTYLTSLGYREGRAALLLSGFWVTFLAARLVTAFLQTEVLATGSEAWLICLLAFLAAVVLGNLAGAAKLANAGAGLLLLGFLLGPIFPTLVGVLFNHVAKDENRGTAFGAMFALGATGNLILPPVIGAYARRTTIQRSLRIPMVVALFLAAASLMLVLSP